MRKLKLDKKGLSTMVAVIVLMTLVLVLGAIIAGTLSGAPRPVLPAVTAVNIATEYGGNPAAGDKILVIRHEYGQPITDAIVLDNIKLWGDYEVTGLPRNAGASHWNNMKLKINGKEAPFVLLYLTSNGENVVNILTPDFNLLTDTTKWVWPKTEPEAGAMDFAKGDLMVILLFNPEFPFTSPLESGDRIQLAWEPRDLMLVEYLVQ